jgi:hypothetical protein
VRFRMMVSGMIVGLFFWMIHPGCGRLFPNRS